MNRILGAILLAVILVSLAGCGGDDNNVAPGPRPSADNATVAGKVVQADNPAVGLAGAIITEAITGQTTESDDDGLFMLSGLPAGGVELRVECPMTPAYGGATVRVPTQARRATTVNVSVLPVSVGNPTALLIDPEQPTIEQGGTVQFRAAVYVGTTKKDVQPTWMVSSDNVASIDQFGLLRGLSPGSVTVTATAGKLTRTTGAVVTGLMPPFISSLLLSASTAMPLPATGGPVTITAAISDGQGVRTFSSGTQKGLTFEIFAPDGTKTELVPGEPVAGTIYDGTWRATYVAPPNDAEPDATGTQPMQIYSVRVAARDYTGAESFSEFRDFGVSGVDSPPPVP